MGGALCEASAPGAHSPGPKLRHNLGVTSSKFLTGRKQGAEATETLQRNRSKTETHRHSCSLEIVSKILATVFLRELGRAGWCWCEDQGLSHITK